MIDVHGMLLRGALTGGDGMAEQRHVLPGRPHASHIRRLRVGSPLSSAGIGADGIGPDEGGPGDGFKDMVGLGLLGADDLATRYL